jgi:hypothetical protein
LERGEGKMSYLILNAETRQWWAPEARGYTPHLDKAGRFTLAEAANHCNPAYKLRYGLWNAVMVPAPESVVEANANASS